MNELTINFNDLLAVCSAIGIIWGTYKIYKEFRKPNYLLNEKVKRHDELFENDNERLKEVEGSNKILCECMLVLINHEITGNGYENMKNVRDKLQKYLIEK